MFKDIRALWALYKNGYLREQGWFRSFREKKAVNNHGEPVPWMNYAVTEFLAERLNTDMNLLEFGAGGSTLFFAKHCRSVVTLEADELWFEKIKRELPENVELLWKPQEKFYELDDIKASFEVIVIDAMDRNRLLEMSLQHCSSDGVIILDDSERSDYIAGIAQLKTSGWKQLRFSGIGPIQNASKETSIFYRAENCFQL